MAECLEEGMAWLGTTTKKSCAKSILFTAEIMAESTMMAKKGMAQSMSEYMI